MKKLYYLADALTLGEVIAGCVLLVMAITHAPAEHALVTFVLGELCDAFDGPLARRWPYPNDGKVRWWRVHVIKIEHGSDIFIAVACMIYLMCSGNAYVAKNALNLGVAVICYCACVEYGLRNIRFSDKNRTRIILVRRWVYAFGGIGGGIYLLIQATSWLPLTKLCVTIFGICVGLMLLIYKLDRALKP